MMGKMMETITCKEVRDKMSDVVNKVAFGHKRFTITRRGNGIAVLISIDEWREIELALQKIEDEDDIRDAELAMKRIKKDGGIPLSKMKKELGL